MNLKETFKLLISWKMLAMFTLGFISGFPFYILKDVLKAWMTESHIDIRTIGLFSAITVPYTFKFIWSPTMDSFVPPFLGRRRGWMLITQIALMISLIVLGQFDPQNSIQLIAITALVVAFFGASQDIVLDAFRREYLKEEEMGFGTGVWMNAWRFGMYASVGASFFANDHGISYETIFVGLSLVMLVGIITTLLVPEPPVEKTPPLTLKESVTEPFIEFFKRSGAVYILLFILLYKIGDTMAGAMNIPFILKQGYSKSEYFVVVKGFGVFALFFGVLVGGTLMTKMGTIKSLWFFGVLQGISTALFALIVFFDHNNQLWSDIRIPLLSFIVAFEFFSTGMGQAAYASYMALQTNKRFTATQYALLTSLMAVPGTIVAAITGYLVAWFGWSGFYIFCALIALPGLFILTKIPRWTNQSSN